jgi:hypothetical protein
VNGPLTKSEPLKQLMPKPVKGPFVHGESLPEAFAQSTTHAVDSKPGAAGTNQVQARAVSIEGRAESARKAE